VIFLLGFLVIEAVTSESKGSIERFELFTDTEEFYSQQVRFVARAKHDIITVVHGNDIVSEAVHRFVTKIASAVRNTKQLHVYAIVAAPIGELSEESFNRRFALARDPSIEGRWHYYFMNVPVSFGCEVFDQTHWSLDFPPNPADPRGAAILFKDDPDGARLVTSFIRHQWLEVPGITMSLSEAYEMWKALQSSTQAPAS
jgi:hypothetical protein